jgi:ribulokinase
MGVLIGIDLGTEGARVGVFDESGTELASAVRGYETRTPVAGWAEQDPQAWWDAITLATREALDMAGRRDVAGLALATMSSTVVACRADGTPLRPAILWMDARAWCEALSTRGLSHPVMRYSGGADAAEWLVPKAMWLARNEPEVYRQADRIVEALDWLVFRLTGTWASSQMQATCKSNYDPLARRYHPSLFEDMGIEGALGKFPESVLPVGAPIAEVTREAAEQLGISGRPLVAQGGIDAHIAMLATGRPEPGHIFTIAGTSNVLLALTAQEQAVPGIWGPYPEALIPGTWLLEGGQVSSGSVLRWVTRKLLGLDDRQAAALVVGAAKVPPGANSLLVLDYWMGNRTPYRDERLRGVVAGLSLSHTPEDVYRAAVESICYGTRNILQTYTDAGVGADRITVSGGVRHNPLWLQLTADVLGRPYEFAPAANLTTVAGAVCAATALGHGPDLASCSRTFAVSTRTIEPDLTAKSVYDERFALYREATAAFTGVLHKLSSSAAAVAP